MMCSKGVKIHNTSTVEKILHGTVFWGLTALSLNYESKYFMHSDLGFFSRKTPPCGHFIKYTEQCTYNGGFKRWNLFSTHIHTLQHWKYLKNQGDLALFISIPVAAMRSHTEPSCGTAHCSFVFLWLVELRSAQDRPSIPSAPAAHTSLTRTRTTCKVPGLFYPVQMKSPQTIRRPLICPVSVPAMDHRSRSSFYWVIVPAA